MYFSISNVKQNGYEEYDTNNDANNYDRNVMK